MEKLLVRQQFLCTYNGTAILIYLNHRKLRKETNQFSLIGGEGLASRIIYIVFLFAVLLELIKMNDGGARRGRQRRKS